MKMNISAQTRKMIASGVVFLGTLGIVKSWQDVRYLKRDLRVLTETQLTERDLERVKEKYKLTPEELQQIKTKAKEQKHVVENLLETDPNFRHKRARPEER